MSKRVPITLILDDSGPINTMYMHGQKTLPAAGVERVRNVPVPFLERFVEVTGRLGMRGKFTLVPNPLGLGQLDEGIPGYPQADLERFLDIVREQIAPNWDITPELLTHWMALDLVSGKWLDMKEDAWAELQDADSLTAYYVHALEILKNVDIPANGITSPWHFAQGVEEAHAEAVGRSLREVFDVKQAWYFLHTSNKMEEDWVRIMRRDDEAGTAVVTVVGNVPDAYWKSQYHPDAADAREAIREGVDGLLSADGTRGRIVDLIEAGQPVVMVTHWQSMFCNGFEVGLDALEKLVGRVNERFGDRIEWTTPSVMAKRALAEGANT